MNKAEPRELSRETLEALGAAVPQRHAKMYRKRWLNLIRDVGSGQPPHETITYTGGDVTDGVLSVNGNVTWVLSDFLPNVDVDIYDHYSEAPIGPRRNGLIGEIPEGNWGSSHTTQGEWISAQNHGGYGSGLWWPLTVFVDANGDTWVGCWFNDGQHTPDSPYGEYVDTHFVRLNQYGLHASDFAVGATDKTFYVQCARIGYDDWIYVLGGEFHPPIDNVPTGTTGYAQTDDLEELRDQPDFTLRLARAPMNDFSDLSSWEWWVSHLVAEWSDDREDAGELVDMDAHLIHGSAGFAAVKPDLWVMAVHQMADPFLDVFNAYSPEGPWRPIARVPIPGTAGREVDGGVQIAWHTKVIEHLEAPYEHSIAMLTSWPKGFTNEFTQRDIRRYAPIFVTIPWY